MNRYNFSDLTVGMQADFSTEITEEKMNCFKEITEDLNPLHTDDAYAVSKGFRGRVSYGLLTSAFFSRLAGMFLPGEKSLIEEVSYKFMLPVYIGDRLIVSGEITALDDRTRQLFLKVTIRREADRVPVVRGKMTIGMTEERI